jgi:hypothetical protein
MTEWEEEMLTDDHATLPARCLRFRVFLVFPTTTTTTQLSDLSPSFDPDQYLNPT